MFKGRKVLILEDEPLIAAALEETVTDLGCLVTVVHRVRPAILLLENESFDAAFVDMSLEGELSIPVAHALTGHHTPFAFMTGHDSTEVRELFGEAPLLRKPFKDAEVFEVLKGLCNSDDASAARGT